MIYVSMALRSVNDHKLLAITRGDIKRWKGYSISTIMFLAQWKWGHLEISCCNDTDHAMLDHNSMMIHPSQKF